MNDQPTPDPSAARLDGELRSVLAGAAEPMTFAQVKTKIGHLYPRGKKKNPQPPKPADSEIQQALDSGVKNETLFVYPPLRGKAVRYATTAPPPPPPEPSPREIVSQLVAETLASGSGPFTESQLANKPKNLSNNAYKSALAETIADFKQQGRLFEHPPLRGKAVRYATTAPPPPPPEPPPEPSPREIVSQLVAETLASGSGPFTESQLANKPKNLSNNAYKSALAETIADFKQQARLFEHPPLRGNAKRYATYPPPVPKWYETQTYKGPFGDAVKAARKVMELDELPVSIDEFFASLRAAVAPPPAEPTPPPRPVAPPPPSPPAPPADLRTVLRQAYDELCQLVEFRDKLVEIRRLYYEAAKRMPSMSVQQFHDELWQLSNERLVELHVLNEVYLAKDPELAINKNDRLYYYARWK